MRESGIKVDAESLDHAVRACAWEQENLKPGDCASRAQQYFDELLALEPSSDVLMRGYDWILEAWSKSSSDGSSEKAERIFEEMQRIRREKSRK